MRFNLKKNEPLNPSKCPKGSLFLVNDGKILVIKIHEELFVSIFDGGDVGYQTGWDSKWCTYWANPILLKEGESVTLFGDNHV